MKNLVSILLLVTFLFTSCAKEGLGGDATLSVFPVHHTTAIVSTGAYLDSVFIKFNTEEIPADPIHDYDALFVGEVGKEHVHCAGLKWGYYSVYCTGWDTLTSQRVVGGVLLKIKRSDRKNDIDVIVPVTED